MMTKPTYDELLSGWTQWRKQKDGVIFLLSFHGYREDQTVEGVFLEGHPGTWCYYLLIPEQMYPHRWPDFACVRGEEGFESPGTAWDRVKFDSEITWSSSEPYWCRKTGREFDGVKVGCDYSHLWHREMGYADTFSSVTRDAEATVASFLGAHPDRHFRCEYGGTWDEPGNFYIAINGRRVHNSLKGTFREGWAKNWEEA
jgi:hypothetical protein